MYMNFLATTYCKTQYQIHTSVHLSYSIFQPKNIKIFINWFIVLFLVEDADFFVVEGFDDVLDVVAEKTIRLDDFFFILSIFATKNIQTCMKLFHLTFSY